VTEGTRWGRAHSTRGVHGNRIPHGNGIPMGVGMKNISMGMGMGMGMISVLVGMSKNIWFRNSHLLRDLSYYSCILTFGVLP